MSEMFRLGDQAKKEIIFPIYRKVEELKDGLEIWGRFDIPDPIYYLFYRSPPATATLPLRRITRDLFRSVEHAKKQAKEIKIIRKIRILNERYGRRF